VALALVITYEADRAAARVEVSGILAGTASLTVERIGPSGTAASVRGAHLADWSAGVFLVRDYEAPLGVELTYTAIAYNAAGVELGRVSQTFALPSGALDDPWLVDLAFPTNSEQVTVESLRELAFETPTGVHRVINRRDPVLTSSASWTPSGDLIFSTASDLQRDRARAILGTGVPVLLRTPPEQGVGNMYLGIRSFAQERPSRIALYADRRFRCQVVQVDRPDPSVFVPVPPVTYQVVEDTYATYAELLAAGSYDDVLYDYPLVAGEVGFAIPWPANDV
jgi:hypothetical protein